MLNQGRVIIAGQRDANTADNVKVDSSGRVYVTGEGAAPVPVRGETVITIDVVAVDNTANGQTLAGLLGHALHSDVRRIYLRNQEKTAGRDIFFDYGDATAAAGSSYALEPGETIPIPGDKTALDNLKFISADATGWNMAILQLIAE